MDDEDKGVTKRDTLGGTQEMVIINEDEQIDTDLINTISANLIKEAYPVCYGNDTRWANHLYPVYLTETFCKSKYYNSDIILNLF